MQNRILFIANPTSRIIDEADIESEIELLSGASGFKWEIYYTEKDRLQLKIRNRISEYQPGLVVVIGGDGTVNPVATALIGSNIELGIIPGGSANGLAYNLNIPSGFKDAMNVILNEEAKPLDAILLNNRHYCFHISDVGINARIVKRFEQEGSKGLAGYGKQMIRELFSKRDFFHFKVITRGRVRKFKAELLAIANARFFGTGAVINPVGQFDDGKFELIIIKPYPWWAVFQLIRMFLFGRVASPGFIKLISTAEAEIVFYKKHDLQIDGEIIKDIRSLSIKTLPSAVKVRYRMPEEL